MPQEPKLPPLDKEAFDGYREEASIPRDQPIEKRCNHQTVKIISSTEIKCGCGVGWTGNAQEIQMLASLLQSS